jgi:hypothetical protein
MIDTLRTRAELDRLAAAYATLAPHRLPLVRAARDGLINLIEPNRRAAIPAGLLNERRRPTVILIGDDDHASTGPAGWACARRLRYWGRAAMIHAAGASREDYEVIVIGAALHQRTLMIEAATTNQAEWTEFFRPHMGCVVITCPPGEAHPTQIDAANIN